MMKKVVNLVFQGIAMLARRQNRAKLSEPKCSNKIAVLNVPGTLPGYI